MHRPEIRSIGLWLPVVLAACGGGGGEAEAPAVLPASPAASAPAPASPAPPGQPTRAGCNLPSFQADLVAAINAARRAGANCGARGSFAATSSLAWNDALASAALVHSDDMVARNFFDHTGSDGRSGGDRATAAGYPWSAWGENIAAGYGSVSVVMAGWMSSPGHCANIMTARFQHVGAACVAGGAGNAYGSYWTLVLAAPR